MSAALADQANHGAVVNLGLNIFYESVNQAGPESWVDIIHAHSQKKNIADKIFTAKMHPVILFIGELDITDESEGGIVTIGQTDF